MRLNDISSEIGFGFRRNLKPVTFWIIIPVLVLAALGWLGVGIYALVQDKDTSPPPDAASKQIPIETQTIGVLVGFDCIRAGEACSEYANAKTYLTQIIPHGLTYPSQDDPAVAATTGPLADLTDDQWTDLADGISLGGTVTSDTVTEDGIRTQATTTHFTVEHEGRALGLSFAFTAAGQQWALDSVTYEG